MPKGNARACQKKHSIRVSHLAIHINESRLSNTPFLFFVFLKLQFISNEIMPKLSLFNQTVQAQKDNRDHYQGFPFRYHDFSQQSEECSNFRLQRRPMRKPKLLPIITLLLQMFNQLIADIRDFSQVDRSQASGVICLPQSATMVQDTRKAISHFFITRQTFGIRNLETLKHQFLFVNTLYKQQLCLLFLTQWR